jgi:hypothetical protein
MTIPDPHANQVELTQDEKRSVLENDRKVREQGVTFKNFADAAIGNEATRSGGRFAKLDVAPVVKPLPPNSPWSSQQPRLPDEAPLGFDINAVPDLGFPLNQSVAQAPASSPAAVETVTDERGGPHQPASSLSSEK